MGLVVFTNDAEAFRREITALVGEKSGEAMMMDRLALHFDLDSEADTDTQEKLVKALRSRSWEAMKSTGKDFYGMSSLNVDTRALCRRDYLSFFGGLFFLGMVLGPLFSIAAVLIMYYKQICEGYEDAESGVDGCGNPPERQFAGADGVLCAAADGGAAYAVCDADDSADFRGIWIA